MDNFPVLPPAAVSRTMRVFVVAVGLAVAVAVIWGATLAARQPPPVVRSVNDADFDPTAADAICSAGQRKAAQDVSRESRKAH